MKIAYKNNLGQNIWQYAEAREDELENQGYVFYETDLTTEDMSYWAIKDGIILIDEERKCLDQENFKKAKEIQVKRNRLTALSQDIVQDMAGEIILDIEKRKAEFVQLHNELRALLGKPPRAQKVEV